MEFPKMSLLAAHCKNSHNCLPQVNCVCGKTLGTWKRLLIHKRKHLKESNGFQCSECSMFYLRKSSLEAHILSKHGPDKKVFECLECRKTFKEMKILKGHMRVHLPEELKRTVTCEICDKKCLYDI